MFCSCRCWGDDTHGHVIFTVLEKKSEAKYIQHQSNVWTHILLQGFFFIFYYFLHCRIRVKTSERWNNTYVNHIVTKKGHQQEEQTCLGQETWAMDFRLVEICSLVWWVRIWDFGFQPPCLCETQSRWTDDLRMCGSHREAWRCDGALLVTLSVIYLEFKAHLTSMATTAFCRDTPYHLVGV